VVQTIQQRANRTDALPKADAPTARPAPAFRVESVKREHRYIKGMIYGPYGTGKTVLASTAQDVPGMADVLFIDAEAGGMSISNRHDIDTIRINSYKAITQVHEYLRAHCRYRDEGNTEKLLDLEETVRGERPKTPKQYRTVVLDSLTEIQKYLMYQLLGVEIGTQRLDREMEQPQFAEWGRNSEMIRLLVRSFRDLPMNVLFICSDQVVEDERKMQHRRPNLPGKLANDVQGFLDVVGYYASTKTPKGETLRRLLLQPTERIQAKNRFSTAKVDYLDNPTMADVMKLVTNG